MEETAKKHLEKLGRHGAKIKKDQVMIPVTPELYDEAMEACRKNRYTAMAWELTIPETDEKLLLCIQSNGHVDSGSVEHICEILDITY